MEQNSEDSQGSRTGVGLQLRFERSAEIHSGEVKRERVSSARAPRNAKLFCGISLLLFFLNKLTTAPPKGRTVVSCYLQSPASSRMFSSVMLPWGPVPFTESKLTPRSFASLLSRGDTRTKLLVPAPALALSTAGSDAGG